MLTGVAAAATSTGVRRSAGSSPRMISPPGSRAIAATERTAQSTLVEDRADASGARIATVIDRRNVDGA